MSLLFVLPVSGIVLMFSIPDYYHSDISRTTEPQNQQLSEKQRAWNGAHSVL
jgi:hypothetical protein